MANFPNIVRGIASSGPVLSFTNKTGTPIANVTGTATRKGAWRLTFKTVDTTGKAVDAYDFHNNFKTSRQIVVSQAYTDIIPGLTITLGATINAGDAANVTYSDIFTVNT